MYGYICPHSGYYHMLTKYCKCLSLRLCLSLSRTVSRSLCVSLSLSLSLRLQFARVTLLFRKLAHSLALIYIYIHIHIGVCIYKNMYICTYTNIVEPECQSHNTASFVRAKVSWVVCLKILKSHFYNNFACQKQL